MSKWIRFSEPLPSRSRKTKTWGVEATADGVLIGHVAWFGRWRKYAFYPMQATVFEQDCLRDIAAFIEARTREHRESKG